VAEAEVVAVVAEAVAAEEAVAAAAEEVVAGVVAAAGVEAEALARTAGT
jgi:hypothetical protein